MLKVYITDLSAYNSGALIGKWVTLPLTELRLCSVISEVLTKGEVAVDEEDHDEWFITDWEWDSIDFFEVNEYDDISTINSNLKLLQEIDPIKLKAVKFILDENYTYDIEEAILKADDVIIHENTKLEDYAYNLMQELYNADKLPSIIANHIDYKGIAKELEYESIYNEVNGDVIVYVN